MGERSRPRDLYDIINMFRRRDLRSQPKLIREVLVEKCQTKGVPIPTFVNLENSPFRSELESEWENMLAHQLPSLPPFDRFFGELPQLFSWLEGQLVETELASMPSDEESDEQWSPPPTVWTWGVGVPVETIRFAAANQLCIELGYQRTKRLIEPYALRRTKLGHTLLCAVKVATCESRTYRLDRIESIHVTPTPFKPVFRVELSSTGPIPIPHITRTTAAQPFRAATTRPKHGTVYIIRCLGCGREFKRRTADYTLRPHKGRGGWQCHSAVGHLVRTAYE